MTFLPKIEKITRDATISHFLLMFGYKLFSLYFPLFLVFRGLSLPEVGYTYLLIYLPMAFSAILVGFFSHKIDSVILAALGIFGYGIYCLGMIFLPVSILFYFFQVVLGVSAALFFVSMREILMSSNLENFNRAFAWFYSAPFYAAAIAPVAGALFIWKFNFFGVFIFSFVLQFFNGIFCLVQLKKTNQSLSLKASGRTFLEKGGFQGFRRNYQGTFKKIKERNVLIPISASLAVLFLVGVYRPFFVLFLKDMGWVQNKVLLFVSLSSLVFSIFSLFIIKRIGELKSEKNILQGAAMSGLFSIILGSLGAFANFCTIFLADLGQSIGGFISSSGRSGLISQKLKAYPKEASVIDTVFSPLGTALGSLVAGLIVGFLGFSNLFIVAGIFVIVVAILGKGLSQK